ncbi:hypothetical protein M9Y10_041197 [Tritrichomonas musculus]|uniref:Myb-like DNA-binding domain containing protein n=1 Tax=Tritrichomonas musculus TaxID=1915356 RepID=A0ABR2K3W1_9EUKA
MNPQQYLQQLLYTGNKRFTEFEDQKLRELVEQFGPRRWRRIAQLMPGRTARQCRDRYCNYLSPDFYNEKWTDEEDNLLIEKHKELGPQWVKIAAFFPGKNANNIKNRWNYRVSRMVQQKEKDQENDKTAGNQTDNEKNVPSTINKLHEIRTNSILHISPSLTITLLEPDDLTIEKDELERGKSKFIPPDLFTSSQTFSSSLSSGEKPKILFPPISKLLDGKSIGSLF